MIARAESALDRGDVLGVGVSAITMDDAVATLESWIEERRREYVCVTGVHGVMECRSDPSLRKIHDEAGMVTPDACRSCISCALSARSARNGSMGRT
ncbi:hypothetical protein [Bradyrhizobium viridifuturi]|uniref:hypothetical protein n=1 Tax=Bradyrhizobium viridifuturi TaxID=1654716 RepID=UPI000AFD5E9E|nr:hypothetical protein [Bradyrhizobium viridifuturi]